MTEAFICKLSVIPPIQLEKQLDQTIFFRANRQYIVNINFIKGFRPFQKVKLLLDMDIPRLEESIIISHGSAGF